MQDEPRPEFGFSCGTFSVGKSAEGYIIPGGKSRPLLKSYVPMVDMDRSAGLYTLEMYSKGKVVCNIPVHGFWVGNRKEPEPFIALKVDDPDDVDVALRQYLGKSVDLRFTPRKT